ncbi:MAG: FAD-dependent monooxygenase, partial [Clostridia bacterium]|nr:FAD-dependent monooxygenase [Clostridia bacterium]
MAKILVAGAGHGGLVAAAQLAKNGFDVTLFEKGKKEDLGHDWEDRFTFSILENIVGKKIDDKDWRYRGDCAFVSPAHRTKVVIKYTDENRQKVMWRKPLIGMLVEYAEKCGVKFEFETAVSSAIVENDKVVGLKTAKGEIRADFIIDAAGAFSPVRMSLPASFGIEKEPKNGDLFYAYRAYFDKNEGVAEEYPPFEVYLYHEGEKGLSWHCTNENNVDILIGRVYPLTNEKVDEQLA